MAEYKIARISTEQPREHFSEKFNSTTYYIKVMVEGHDRPVSVGKKSPDALKVGDTIYGEIVPTQYDTDNFKPETKPNPAFQKRDDSAIKAQWAIGQAVSLFTSGKDEAISDIEKNAKDFYVMVDRVKAQPPQQSGYQQAKEQANKLRPQPSTGSKAFSDGSPVEEFPGSEEINLDDIPF